MNTTEEQRCIAHAAYYNAPGDCVFCDRDMAENAVARGLEMVRCAEINLENMVAMMPALAGHPLLPVVRQQLADAIEALGAP